MNATTKITKTYAKSLFQNILSERKKDNPSFALGTVVSGEISPDGKNPTPLIIGEELLLLGTLLTFSKTVFTFFKNPTTSERRKKEFILTVFPGLTVPMKSFLEILTERGHLYLLPQIGEDYTKFLTKMKGSTKVKIITASKFPTKTVGETLLKSLKQLTNSEEIILNFAYNSKLLGGFVVEYDSFAVDASILKEFSLFFTDI